MRSIAIFLSVLFLSGCSQTLLMKDGMTPQSFEADKFDCEQKVVTMYGGYAQMGAGHAVMARQDMLPCMTTKGYHEATAEELAAAKAPTPEEVWRAKSGSSKSNEYPRPTSCVGQGCTAAQ